MLKSDFQLISGFEIWGGGAKAYNFEIWGGGGGVAPRPPWFLCLWNLF